MIRCFDITKEASRPYAIVRSDNPRRKIWEYLKRFENPPYVETRLRLIAPALDSATLASKAGDIALAINQAESYYQTSGAASLRIRPLLLHYGMLNLAKALIMFGENQYTLSSDSGNAPLRAHGLSHSPLNGNAADRQIRNSESIANEFCYSRGNGMFQLMRQCYSDLTMQPNTRFTVKQLLSLVPEDWEKYRDYFGDLPNVERTWQEYSAYEIYRNGIHSSETRVIVTTSDHQMLDFAGSVDSFIHPRDRETPSNDATIRLIPRLGTCEYINYPLGGGRFYSVNPQHTIDDGIVVSHGLYGDSYALLTPFGFNMNDLDIHFLIMFILSNLVRYAPGKWARMATMASTDELFLLEGFIEMSTTKFPNLILNELEGRRFQFVAGEKQHGGGFLA